MLTELLDVSQNSGVNPLFFAGQFEDQAADLLGSAAAAAFRGDLQAALLLGPDPLQQGVRGHDGGELPQ